MILDEYCNLVLLVLFMIIGAYFVYDKIKSRKKCIDDIPGPAATDQKFGNLLDVKKCGSLHQYLDMLHCKYGDIVTFYWYNKKVVSICTHELFKTVQKLFDRPVVLFENFSSFIGDNCLQFCNGEEALNRRKQYDKAFQHESLMSYISTIAQIGKENLDDLQMQRSPVKSVENMCYIMSVKGIVKSCLSSVQETNKELCENIITLYKSVFNDLETRFVKGETFSKNDEKEIQFQKDKSELYSLIKVMIDDRIKVLGDVDSKDYKFLLIDHIIQFHRETESELIENEVMVYMIAGFHSIGSTLSWCLYYLSKYPEYQEKLFKEITKCPFEFTNDSECYRKIIEMRYLRACINETLRLAQVAAYGGRFSSEDQDIKSYLVPANTPIILAFGVSFKNESVYFSNQKFIPERFLGDNIPSFAFTPFGFAGKRRCPGERFTYLELSIWLIQLVSKYSFCLTNPNQNVGKLYGLVTRMDHDVLIQFTER